MVGARGQGFCLATAMEQTGAINPHVCTVLSYFVSGGAFVHILPFDPHHRTGRPSCFDFLDDETKFREGTDILNKDDC